MTKVILKQNGHDSLESRPTDDLLKELREIIELTQKNLIRMAALVVELESRGEDLSHLRMTIIPHLRRIAANTLLPDAAMRFIGRPLLLTQIAQLPLTEQKRLLDKPEVDVWLPESKTTKKIDLDNLHAHQSYVVFGPAGIRTPAEQRDYLRGAKRPHQMSKRTYRVRPDRERGGVLIGQGFGSAAEVVTALAELTDPLTVLNLDKETETATVRLTEAEKKKLKALEKRRGLPEWHLIREALKALGLI
jgi:hypothetical protein